MVDGGVSLVINASLACLCSLGALYPVREEYIGQDELSGLEQGRGGQYCGRARSMYDVY